MTDNSTPGKFEDILSSATPEIRRICKALRKQIQAMDADNIEIVWPRQRIASYGVGPKKMSEHYVYVAPMKQHVNLGFYHGVTLADPNSLLDGTGKRLRHIKIYTIDDTERTDIHKLIRAAIVDRQQNSGST